MMAPVMAKRASAAMKAPKILLTIFSDFLQGAANMTLDQLVPGDLAAQSAPVDS